MKNAKKMQMCLQQKPLCYGCYGIDGSFKGRTRKKESAFPVVVRVEALPYERGPFQNLRANIPF